MPGLLDYIQTSMARSMLEEPVNRCNGSNNRAQSDKALIVTVHHPPYSLDTAHNGYLEVAIDRVIQATERIPTDMYTHTNILQENGELKMFRMLSLGLA